MRRSIRLTASILVDQALNNEQSVSQLTYEAYSLLAMVASWTGGAKGYNLAQAQAVKTGSKLI
jgi:hypothetical protein